MQTVVSRDIWWLGDPQALRRAYEVQFLSNGNEIPEFTRFEIVHADSLVVIPVEYHWLVDRYWTHLRSTPTMDCMTTKTALVTGANKGIGFAIAHGLGVQGIRVGVGARNDARRQNAVDKLRAAGIDVFGVRSMSRRITALPPPTTRSASSTYW